jgi:NAD(P)-dependent dehydrogenase (short-subunit alcohol dehydrogenase family)
MRTRRAICRTTGFKAGQTMPGRNLPALGPRGMASTPRPGAIPGGGFNADAFDFSGKIALGRLGTDDVAAMTMAVLSDRFAGYVTGTTIAVDGGIDLCNWITPTG